MRNVRDWRMAVEFGRTGFDRGAGGLLAVLARKNVRMFKRCVAMLTSNRISCYLDGRTRFMAAGW